MADFETHKFTFGPSIQLFSTLYENVIQMRDETSVKNAQFIYSENHREMIKNDN